jgi:shikimate kinase
MEKVILVGYMGAGKTLLGKSIAEKLGIRFINSDSDIEQQTGMSVGQLFEQFGENHFRNLEKEYLSSLDVEESFVLATGGGTPCYNNQMDVLNSLGTTIYLQCSNETLFSRLKHERDHRPLIAGLSDEELRESINIRMKQREAIYQLAQFTIIEEEQKTETIIHRLRQRN